MANEDEKMRDDQIKRLALSGVLAAAIILLTALVSIPLPGGHGYINLGDAGVLTAAFILGGPWGALCGGLASAAADLLLGWGIYAPATLVIKAAMALAAAGIMARRRGRGISWSWGVYPGALLVPCGYFLFETALYGLAAALPNLPLNLVQCLVGAALAHGAITVLSKKNMGVSNLGNQTEKRCNRPGSDQGDAAPVEGEHAASSTVKEETDQEAVIVREPKGGPDLVFLGCEADIPALLKAGDYLSVRGYTARIVKLPAGRTLDAYPPEERRRFAPEGIPYIYSSQCGSLSDASPKELANAALEALNP